MLKKKNLTGLLSAATMTLLAGCGVPGGFGAPATPVTSATPVQPTYTPAPQAESGVRTMPVEAPPNADGSMPSASALPAGAHVRTALLLPLESQALPQPAEAVRAGFMAGHERDRAGTTVNLVPTGDSSQ